MLPDFDIFKPLHKKYYAQTNTAGSVEAQEKSILFTNILRGRN